ncbi:MAG: WecB/TagA/CpsF family glycosyltransferase [Hyphomicrobium sp.]|uniref:WecB/TagA/CpsF family glycosyltransferase n=1 Tax=Hyphomicrobium sp. TaxID=82 RepID=UPI0039E68576
MKMRERVVSAEVFDVPALSRAPSALERNVFCVLGIPLDVETLHSAVDKIFAAANRASPFLIVTPNVNFLINSIRNPEFRNSLNASSLSLADGVPIVMMARLLGVPLIERVAGSDILSRLSQGGGSPRLQVFLFGGELGAAEAAEAAINQKRSNVTCVGSFYPGYGSVDQLSRGECIDRINRSGAQFLIAALGAEKGQSWLYRNHDALKPPVRAHLGAAISFESGKLKRAPRFMQQCGLEWLWRIKEEPYLWRRYWNDALALSGVVTTRLLPLLLINTFGRSGDRPGALNIDLVPNGKSAKASLHGAAVHSLVPSSVVRLNEVIDSPIKNLVLDIADVDFIDARYFGLLLMLQKELQLRGGVLSIVGASKKIRRLFHLNELGHMLEN